MTYRSDFGSDMQQPLDKVERSYIRIPVTIILSPVGLIVVILAGMFKSMVEVTKIWWTEFMVPCWIGPHLHHGVNKDEIDITKNILD